MKEDIVFVHGLTGSKRAFHKQMDYFDKEYRTYSYDLIGHGENKNTSVPFTLDHLVRQLENLFEKEGIDRAHICSLSYGCYPSIIFANRKPDRVASLCCIGGHYNAQSPLFDIFEHYWNRRDEEYELWLKDYSHAIYPKEGLLDPYSLISQKVYYKYAMELQEDILKNALEHRLTYNLRADLEALRIPILWVMGSHDFLYKSTLTELQTIIPHVIYKEIHHAGHAANLFRPHCFRDMYEEFLYSISNRVKKSAV